MTLVSDDLRARTKLTLGSLDDAVIIASCFANALSEDETKKLLRDMHFGRLPSTTTFADVRVSLAEDRSLGAFKYRITCRPINDSIPEFEEVVPSYVVPTQSFTPSMDNKLEPPRSFE